MIEEVSFFDSLSRLRQNERYHQHVGLDPLNLSTAKSPHPLIRCDMPATLKSIPPLIVEI